MNKYRITNPNNNIVRDYKSRTTNIPHDENSKVFLNGEFNHNFNGKHSSQMYNLYNGKLTQLQKMQIIMPNIETDKFESTYRR